MAKTDKLKKYILYTWLAVLTPLFLLFIYLVLAGYGFLGFMPSFEELENPKSALASEIFSADGKVIGKYYIENRSSVNFNNISPNVVNALVATEDARFFKHSGIDVKALGRAVFGFVTGRSNTGGASTITQQLAKNLFPRQKGNKLKTILRKTKEWIIAVKLEKNYTKEEIMAMYLNTVDFGSNSYGIKSAAKTFFNKSPDSLNIQEAAVLVGLLKAPTFYSPVRNPERSLKRRNVVMSQMRKYEFLTDKQYDSLKIIPIKVSYSLEDHNTGSATYFREVLRDEIKKWLTNVKKPDGSSYDLYKDGLKIYTTLDSRLQQYAEEAVTEHLGKDLQDKFFKHWAGKKEAPFYQLSSDEVNKILAEGMKRSDRYRALSEDGKSESEIEKIFKKPLNMRIFTWKGEKDTLLSPWDSVRYYKSFLQTGVLSVDPQTGYIKAWVGGIDYKHFKYDHVKQGRRQVGSTFKPFVYALAMQEGWSPCLQVPNVPVTFELPEGGNWSPKNSDGKYGGMMSLKRALATSTNCVTAYVMKHFGPQAVVDLARRMGITSPLDAVPSLALGTSDITLFEMVGANATFANKGVWNEPTYLLRIEDRYGNVLHEFVPKSVEAMSEQTAYLTLKLMQGVTDFGTGIRLRFRYDIRTPLAGKTGTTQNNSDGWFMGLTPDLVTGVWVGCEDRSAHFRSTDLGQGATMALPIFAFYMKKVYADKKLKISQGDFEKPENPLNVEIDCNKYNQEHGGVNEKTGEQVEEEVF